MLKQARERSAPWDMIIVGGGATGAGVAVDAATRGYATLLLEQHDFGKEKYFFFLLFYISVSLYYACLSI